MKLTCEPLCASWPLRENCWHQTSELVKTLVAGQLIIESWCIRFGLGID